MNAEPTKDDTIMEKTTGSAAQEYNFVEILQIFEGNIISTNVVLVRIIPAHINLAHSTTLIEALN